MKVSILADSELKKKLGELRVNTTLCVGCGLCVETCQRKAISIYAGMSRIDQDKCIGCGLCADVCPQQAIIEKVPVSQNDLEATISSLKQRADELVKTIESLRK